MNIVVEAIWEVTAVFGLADLYLLAERAQKHRDRCEKCQARIARRRLRGALRHVVRRHG